MKENIKKQYIDNQLYFYDIIQNTIELNKIMNQIQSDKKAKIFHIKVKNNLKKHISRLLDNEFFNEYSYKIEEKQFITTYKNIKLQNKKIKVCDKND